MWIRWETLGLLELKTHFVQAFIQVLVLGWVSPDTRNIPWIGPIASSIFNCLYKGNKDLIWKYIKSGVQPQRGDSQLGLYWELCIPFQLARWAGSGISRNNEALLQIGAILTAFFFFFTNLTDIAMCLFYREQIAVFKDYSLNHMYKSKNAAKHENLTDYKASHIRGKEQWRLWFPTKSQKTVNHLMMEFCGLLLWPENKEAFENVPLST